jgi:hypothetical protein
MMQIWIHNEEQEASGFSLHNIFNFTATLLLSSSSILHCTIFPNAFFLYIHTITKTSSNAVFLAEVQNRHLLITIKASYPSAKPAPNVFVLINCISDNMSI